MKKVVYVGGFELPDKNAAAQRVLANAKLLLHYDYEVTFISVSRKNEKFLIVPVENNKGVNNLISYPTQYPTTIMEWFCYITSIRHIKFIIKEKCNNCVDIIIAYDYPAVSMWRLNKFCKKRNIKLIADTTEWYEPQGALLFRIIKSIDTNIRMRFLQKKVDGIIAISQYLYEYYKTQNAILLPPLIDKTEQKWAKIPFRLNDCCQLIYVGSPGKGRKDRLDLVISSLIRLHEKGIKFIFIIVGISKSEYLNAFSSSNVPSNLDEYVHFKGKLSHERSIHLIKESDYSIFLRDRNLVNTAGFPTKLVESISCGTPVLSNATSDIYKYLKDGKLGFIIDDSSFDSIDDSIINAINLDRNHLLRMKEFCYSYTGFDYHFYLKEFSHFLSKI